MVDPLLPPFNIVEETLRPDSRFGGGVRRYRLPTGDEVSRITTFCPATIGPGPTHLYVFRDDTELILVDTGIPTALARSLFYNWRNQPVPRAVEELPDDFSEQQLKEGLGALGYQVSEISTIIITHGHFDHYLLGRNLLKQNRGIKTVAHLFDTDMICNPWEVLRTWVLRRPELLALGMPPPRGEDKLQRMWEHMGFGLRVHHPLAWDGAMELKGKRSSLVTVRNFQGHSPGSISLIIGRDGHGKLMLCGDLLLNPITPHPDNLLAYLRSLRELKTLEEVRLVLPGHGMPIEDLRARSVSLELHHRRRLELAYCALRQPQSVWDIATMDGYFDIPVDRHGFNPLAAQEAFVHVALLETAGAVKPAEIRNGIQHFMAGNDNFDAVYSDIQELVAKPTSVVPVAGQPDRA